MNYNLNSEYSIELKNVSKTFRIQHEKANSILQYLTSVGKRGVNSEEIHVLKDISFSVKKGEMLGVLGLNGSGKTTLLKILAKILSPDEGIVNINGMVTPFLELGTGFNGELTAKDNIILYGIILGFSRKEINEKIDSIIKFAELEKFLDTKLKNFSSGMNARLAFSTAMQVDPDILLVDEVLAVGDAPFKEKSFNAFMSFKKKGKTIVYVSHAMDQIKNLCDKAMLIHRGRIRAFGKPADVIKFYNDMLSGEPNEENKSLKPWFHDFSSFGIKLDSSLYNPGQRSLQNQLDKEPVITRFLARAFKDCKDRPSVLDLFCSDGYYSIYAAETFHPSKVVAMDNKPRLLACAKSMSKKLGLDIIEFKSDLESLDIREKFDIVLNTRGLPDVEDPRKLLEITYNLTNKFAIVQSVVTLETEDENYFVHAPDSMISRFTDGRLRKWLEEFDWEVISHERNNLRANTSLQDKGSSYYLLKKRD